MHTKFDPSNYYFLCWVNPAYGDEILFYLTPKNIWDNEHRFTDIHDDNLTDFLNNVNFFEVSTGCFEFANEDGDIGDYEQGRKALTKMGFIENPEMNTGGSPSILYPPRP